VGRRKDLLKEPWQWQEDDIQALIREQRPEDLGLEYKRSDALAKTDVKKAEITKDVSAMANSAGGVIIYGIDEQRKSNGPIKLDSGINPDEISREWLEQVIDSGIRRKIGGFRINPVKISDTGRLVYAVWVPQSNWAPHMAADHRYYKRLGTITAPMEEYEVRDVARRSESPDLHLDFRGVGIRYGQQYGGCGTVLFYPRITNRSVEPAFYATIKFYMEEGLYLLPNFGQMTRSGDTWTRLDDVGLIWNNRDRLTFHVARYAWSVPEQHPILEDDSYDLQDLSLKLDFDPDRSSEIRRYNIGWELRTPKAAPKRCGLKLTVNQTGPSIGTDTFAIEVA
jgi:hypothetical protein